MKRITLILLLGIFVLFGASSCLFYIGGDMQNVPPFDVKITWAVVVYDLQVYEYENIIATFKLGYIFIEGAEHPPVRIAAIGNVTANGAVSLFGMNNSFIYGMFELIQEEN